MFIYAVSIFLTSTAFADIKAKDSLALWERCQPKADGEGNGEGNNHALSPADAGALPKGAFGLRAPRVRLLFLTSTAFVDTKAKPRARRGEDYSKHSA